MVKISMRGYKPVEFQWHTLTIKCGGRLNRGWPLVTKKVKAQNNLGEECSATYVHIKSRDAWLNQAVLGASGRGEMYSALLTELHERIVAMEDRIKSGLPPVGSSEPEGPDPMDEMGVLEEPETNKQPTRKKKIPFRGQAVHTRMSEWPKEAITGGACMVMRDVSIYLEGQTRLWLHTKDVEWLIRSLWIQQQLKGVGDVASDDEGPDSPKSMEDDMTPEKRPQPQEIAGHLYDKWDTAP